MDDRTWCNGSSAKAAGAFPNKIESVSSRSQVGKTVTILLKPLERVYDGCVGGFLAEKSRIHLRIASDGTLRGEVRRKQQLGATSGPLANGKKRKRRAIAEHPDGIVIAHMMGNAQVVPVEDAVVSSSSSADSDDTSTAEYCCAFEIAKRLNHVDRHTLTCHLHVPAAPDALAVGTWRFFGVQNQPERHQLHLSSSASTASTGESSLVTREQVAEKGSSAQEQKVFQLQPVQWYQRQQEAEEAEREAALLQSRPPSLLYPLRPGKYEFKGFTTYDTPSVATAMIPRQRNGRRGRPRPAVTTMKDECLVMLRLLPDGTLRGTSREVVQPQVCQLRGRWQANRVAYVLEYHVREAVGHFRYSGAVVIDEGDTGIVSGKKTKIKRKVNVTGKRRETLSGKWHNVDEGHADGYEGGRGEFELELVRVDFTPIAIKMEKTESSPIPSGNSSDISVLQLGQQQMHNTDPKAGITANNALEIEDDDDAIHALTSGKYELSGCATDAEGYEYAFDLQLQLRPDGTLFGKCKERIFHQTSPVFGSWSPYRIEYGQQYVVKQEVGIYKYTAEMSSDGAVVRGSWVNVEEMSAPAPSEHGTFALILVDSTRQWSAVSHVHYPPRFRRGVLTTLMVSARTNNLPVALWIHIFAFCNETWFTPPM